ncbi:aminopeptidase [Thermosediminibacter litoriperuensis]|uniref:Aminopeptidase n=1 Tax=Thermosediminibacter litoriperuensis TaxID=291989 RepID=A0A5S5AWB0_9FIRM|nr:aminopeptidase [Thermosediminibacter litoriperuensis]TYP56685.1 aminopeptidase [Thermosediminibacter litoriperuensis]
MRDPRYEKLARILIHYSVELKEGENILIEAGPGEAPLVKELVREAYRVGGRPFVSLAVQEIQREILMNLSEEAARMMARYDSERMKDMNAYIGIRGGDNVAELSDVPHDKKSLYMQLYVKPVHGDIRVPHTKWCVLRYPNASMAQLADTSTEAFEDFYFKVCCLDYEKMSRAMDPLVELMNRTKKVRIVGPGTDLEFSIEGINAVKCDGKRNIPDGEIYTAPVRNSVNGYITYNAPAIYQGYTFDNIRFEFKDGKIVKATANDTERLNKILDTDEGARYIGEFAIGINPYILKPMKDTLFDEKIAGSIHFTPGRAYEECNNGNESAIHWDLVYIQRPEYGGGEIWFDDVLVRKDGLFVPKELQGLNPENLV